MPRVRMAANGIALGLVLALAAPGIARAADDPTTEDLDRRLRRMENILQSGQIADLIQQQSELERELRELRGQLESLDHRMDELRQRQRNLYGDLDRRMRELEVAGAAPAEAGGADAGDNGAGGEDGGGTEDGDGGAQGSAEATGSGGSGGGDGDPGGVREDYDAAFSLLKDGRYAEAATAFDRFVEQHPDGRYADNAQYWLGESRYVTREFESALEAFRGVIDNYPDSAKVPDARLKIGYSLYELGRMDKAREALERVMREHPDSAVARLAEERLLKIKRESD